MSIYRQHPLTLDRVETYPLRSRPSKISVKNFAGVPGANPTIREWLKSLTHILAGQSFRAVIEALVRSRKRRKPIIWGLGGRVIKASMGPDLHHVVKLA